MKKILVVEAKNLTQAKRKASLIMNEERKVVQLFEWEGMLFGRINKIFPNNTIFYGRWA